MWWYLDFWATGHWKAFAYPIASPQSQLLPPRVHSLWVSLSPLPLPACPLLCKWSFDKSLSLPLALFSLPPLPPAVTRIPPGVSSLHLERWHVLMSVLGRSRDPCRPLLSRPIHQLTPQSDYQRTQSRLLPTQISLEPCSRTPTLHQPTRNATQLCSLPPSPIYILA